MCKTKTGAAAFPLIPARCYAMRDFMKRMNCRVSRVMNTSLRHTTAMFNSSGSRMGSPQARTFLASPAAAAAAALEGKIVHPGKYL